MNTRHIFSDAEKTCLQELIVKYKLNTSSTVFGNQSVKRNAWIRLTEEYNSIETNAKRTEIQLKKCWDNLKTRQKSILTLEKRQRMKTGGGPFNPNGSQPGNSQETLIAEALLDQTDVELSDVIDSDTIYMSEDVIFDVDLQQSPTQPEPQDVEALPTMRPAILRNETTHERVMDTPSRRSGHRITDDGVTLSQGPKNVRTKVIQDEFNIRKNNYTKTEEREDILHELRVKEREWMVKAAKQIFFKVKAEKEAAEELLLCNKAKRELAELELRIKNTKN